MDDKDGTIPRQPETTQEPSDEAYAELRAWQIAEEDELSERDYAELRAWQLLEGEDEPTDEDDLDAVEELPAWYLSQDKEVEEDTNDTAPRLPSGWPANWAKMSKAQRNAWYRERNVLEVNETLVPWGEHLIPDFIAEHLLKVQRAWQKTIAATVETGQVLIAMKKAVRDACEDAGWLQVFEWDLLPFDLRTAQMMMSVAKHPVLSDSQNYAFLPGSLNAQYLLSRMPGGTVTRLIVSRMVTSTTTIAEVADLYVFKVPQLLPKLSKIATAHTASSVATVAGYELWREEQGETCSSIRQVAAWLNVLADALEREAEERKDEWRELLRSDEREDERTEVRKKKKPDAFMPLRGPLPRKMLDDVTVRLSVEADLGDDMRYRDTAYEKPTDAQLAVEEAAAKRAAEEAAWNANAPATTDGEERGVPSGGERRAARDDDEDDAGDEAAD